MHTPVVVILIRTGFVSVTVCRAEIFAGYFSSAMKLLTRFDCSFYKLNFMSVFELAQVVHVFYLTTMTTRQHKFSQYA